MRRVKWIALAVVVALAAAGAAIAFGGHGWKTEAVAADFSATEVVGLHQRTCTGTDGHMYRSVHVLLRGTLTPDTTPLGKGIVLRLRLKDDLTAGLGTTDGKAWFLDAAGDRLGSARVLAVNTGSSLNGMFFGHAFGHRELESHSVKPGSLVANFTATLDANFGLTGALGKSSSTDTAVIRSSGSSCEKVRGEEEGRGRKGKLEVKKSLSPTDDLGRFALSIKQGATTVDSEPNAGHDGTTGENLVAPGVYEVSEAGGTVPATDPADYTSSVECKNDNGTVVASNATGAPLSVTVGRHDDIVCTFTNTRKATP